MLFFVFTDYHKQLSKVFFFIQLISRLSYSKFTISNWGGYGTGFTFRTRFFPKGRWNRKFFLLTSFFFFIFLYCVLIVWNNASFFWLNLQIVCQKLELFWDLEKILSYLIFLFGIFFSLKNVKRGCKKKELDPPVQHFDF